MDTVIESSALPRPRQRAAVSQPTTQVSSLRDTWSFFWRSRLFVWSVGSVAVLLLGTASGAVHAFDQTGISSSYGRLGNILVAPAVRWDAIHYLRIAHEGYRAARETAFYPLYPLLIHIGTWLTGSPALAGVLISLIASFIGLELVRRLTELELGPITARTTVLLMTFGPMALFFSAVYTESLFLALSAACLYSARRGRWALAGLAGGLAALTRVTGVVLIVPVLIMYLYGPREDAVGRPGAAFGWRPRYVIRPSILWAGLIPLGALAFAAYLDLRGFGAAATLHEQQSFSRHHLVVPVSGIWQGLLAAWHQLKELAEGVNPLVNQTQGLLQALALAVVLPGCVAVWRRLPPAYAAYVLLGVLLPLSTPMVGDPLRGFARYASILFPLYMCLAAWAVRRGLQRTLLAASVVLLVLFTVQFSTWHLVGGLLV